MTFDLRAIVERYYEEVWNGWNLTIANWRSVLVVGFSYKRPSI